MKFRKVVVAHGVENPGDPVFHAFKDQFVKLDENQFVNFWAIYLVSLAHEQFIKGKRYSDYLKDAGKEISAFRNACSMAHIPEIKAKKSLKDILQWTLHVLSTWSPKVTYKSPDGLGELQFELFSREQPTLQTQQIGDSEALPQYVNNIKDSLEAVLRKAELSLWLMIDRLDELFPRRSALERLALRGLLHAMSTFSSETIRVKVFLRDDMLQNVVRGENGFTALTHITARQADTLRWTEDQILTMVVKRIFANKELVEYLKVDLARLDASARYRNEIFYRVFPQKVHKGPKQSATLKWLYNRCADGRNVVTPRDVIDLLSRAKQRQQDDFRANAAGTSEWLIGPTALQYGLEQLSMRKRLTYLEAEFPHLWPHIEKFVGGKTEYSEPAMGKALGKNWKSISEDLVSVGLFNKTTRKKQPVYLIPFLYRKGLEVTQGRAE